MNDIVPQQIERDESSTCRRMCNDQKVRAVHRPHLDEFRIAPRRANWTEYLNSLSDKSMLSGC